MSAKSTFVDVHLEHLSDIDTVVPHHSTYMESLPGRDSLTSSTNGYNKPIFRPLPKQLTDVA